MEHEQICSVVRQGLSYRLWHQFRGSHHSPHVISLQTQRDVISRCGFTKVDKGAVTPPTGPTPESLCRSPQIICSPRSSATTCSLPSASEAKGNCSAMQQKRQVYMHVHMCVCMYTHVHAYTGILLPEPQGSLHHVTSQAGHNGMKGKACPSPTSVWHLSLISSLFQFVL